MFFCYFDESGDSGYNNSPISTFTLAAVVVDEANWLTTLDQLISFRRFLRDQYGVPPRVELKANWLLHGKGAFKNLGLSPGARMSVYEAAMRFQRKVGTISVYAVVINKAKVRMRTVDAREWAWGRALERLERYGTSKTTNTYVHPDEGHSYFIRRLMRRMRRHHIVSPAYGGSGLSRPILNVVEDASDRRSDESYFIQLADLNAYAAFRRVHPRPSFDGSLWDELGSARILEVNKIRGGPPGIVVWP